VACGPIYSTWKKNPERHWVQLQAIDEKRWHKKERALFKDVRAAYFLSLIGFSQMEIEECVTFLSRLHRTKRDRAESTLIDLDSYSFLFVAVHTVFPEDLKTLQYHTITAEIEQQVKNRFQSYGAYGASTVNVHNLRMLLTALIDLARTKDKKRKAFGVKIVKDSSRIYLQAFIMDTVQPGETLTTFLPDNINLPWLKTQKVVPVEDLPLLFAKMMEYSYTDIWQGNTQNDKRTALKRNHELQRLIGSAGLFGIMTFLDTQKQKRETAHVNVSKDRVPQLLASTKLLSDAAITISDIGIEQAKKGPAKATAAEEAQMALYSPVQQKTPKTPAESHEADEDVAVKATRAADAARKKAEKKKEEEAEQKRWQLRSWCKEKKKKGLRDFVTLKSCPQNTFKKFMIWRFKHSKPQLKSNQLIRLCRRFRILQVACETTAGNSLLRRQKLILACFHSQKASIIF
jgi:hypothetical protein